MIGRVVSTKMNKTVTVVIDRVVAHPLYKKTFQRTKNILVDDPIGVKMGDIVEIVKVRPISKNKHWQITKVVGQNLEEIVEAEQKEAAEKVIAEVMPEEAVGESVDQSVSKSEESDTPTNRDTETPKKQTRKKKEAK